MHNTEDNEKITMLTHSIVLVLATNQELHIKHRDLLRSDLNQQYAALCNPSTPVSKYLFGDNLNKKMEDLSKASKHAKKVTPNQRMEPVLLYEYRDIFIDMAVRNNRSELAIANRHLACSQTHK